MGCCAEPAAVHIAHILQSLHLFQFSTFFYNLHALTATIKKLHFLYNSHNLPQKKIARIDRKKNDATIRLFCTQLTFFTLAIHDLLRGPFS